MNLECELAYCFYIVIINNRLQDYVHKVHSPTDNKFELEGFEQ